MRYGSKQDVHIISRGMLGDAMKQILSLGYVLTHVNYDGSAFENRQWEHPLIICHNRKEWKIYLHVDRPAQKWSIRPELTAEELTHADTEIEVVLPIIHEVRHTLDRSFIERFCREYSIFTTDISFKFRILDDSTTTRPPQKESIFDQHTISETDIAKALDATLSTPPPKAIVNIEYPALHPIATEKEWSNSDTIHSYLPNEFMSRLTNVHDKDSARVYDVLLTFREGNNIKNTAKKTEISIAELLSDPDNIKKMEKLYHRAKDALPPPEKLSLPYTTTHRRDALITRVATLYDDLDKEKAFYKLVPGIYKKGKVQYPFAFEILAIPRTEPWLKKTEFIGAVNYSVSPNGIKFEGEYEVSSKGPAYMNKAENIDAQIYRYGLC